MKSISLNPSLFEGAISLQQEAGWVSPWRLPYEQRRFFPSPEENLLAAAHNSSGVRIRFETDARNLRAALHALADVPPLTEAEAVHLDLVVEGELVRSRRVTAWDQIVDLGELPDGVKVAEVWLPQNAPIAVRELLIDPGSWLRAAPDSRPRWVTYGSSLTHCTRAHSPARTWPAILARRHGLNLTNLGFGGQCHLEPMLARLIRDLPADVITLKLGINCISGSLDARTFPGAVLGLVQIIRERHSQTPIVLISPIAYPPHETTPNVVAYTIAAMRDAIRDVQQRLVAAGDDNLLYVNGLDIFDVASIHRYSDDECHPGAEGIEVMAEHFDRVVMPLLGY